MIVNFIIDSNFYCAKKNHVFLIYLFSVGCSVAQDLKSTQWPVLCNVVEILSTQDGKIQPAYFFKSKGDSPRPLVVSLHAWSAGYDEKDTLSWQCIEKNYNYIHPHFRGPNWSIEACGSQLAIADVDDAIAFAIKNSNVNVNEIHIVGVSGGGYATLLAYMKTKYAVKTFSAWVPITNLIDWFYETKSREPKHALDIARATSGINFSDHYYVMNEIEAKKRSPIFMATPVAQRNESKVFIYAGIHDGYTGSVPITHSINFYNKVVCDFDVTAKNAMVNDDEIISLVTYRMASRPIVDSIGSRRIHYRMDYLNKARLTVFEGGHESLSNVALNHIENKRILTIGDSNGAYASGWVNHFQKKCFEHEIYNTAIAGNTIGFNNNGNPKFNTLKNADRYLEDAGNALKRLDAIVIMLGTNDCKSIFADSVGQVQLNMRKLLQKIKSHPVVKKFNAVIYVVSPPPFGPALMLDVDFKNAAKRMEYLQPKLKDVVLDESCVFIDIYSPMREIISFLTNDGIHLTSEGQELIATIIYDKIFKDK